MNRATIKFRMPLMLMREQQSLIRITHTLPSASAFCDSSKQEEGKSCMLHVDVSFRVVACFAHDSTVLPRRQMSTSGPPPPPAPVPQDINPNAYRSNPPNVHGQPSLYYQVRPTFSCW
jgi:hypothetical protein